MKRKTFRELRDEVWDTGLCSGCGACVAVCPADAIIFRKNGEFSSPAHTGYCKDETDGVPCGACYAACPRTRDQDAHRMASTGPGSHLRMISARSGFEVQKRQSGGAVTAILTTALNEGTIDCIVTIAADPWTQKPAATIITDKEVLISKAGSRYAWWVPLLSALKNAVITQKKEKIAIIGVPCAASAARIIQSSNHVFLKPYGRAIRLIIGLFCTETFDYEKLIEGKLQREIGIEPWDIERLDVRGKLIVNRQDGTQSEFPLSELEDYVRPGCHVCGDLTAVDADISAGSIGSGEGYTTLIVRTPTGDGYVNHAVDRGDLIVEGETNPKIIERLAGDKAKRLRR
ncbi:hypothetical protein AZH53_02125 [Methanomicrobiaceae archaeon CYW5]|uniref:Coenzyme F420 hydrogenase/dehydrogenase, beta subunit C-terminal domain n=1 Tax=Methanovulcanius yangii TaxID=1789227 RepID=UPI0029CAAAEC|nr:Coenzyme F420 hydrogenase/dehydrogenase, beta subunit C-terminal domain [Methanovulcanius yangii]MBT8507226.1 hypothetical protein [Methanovulcanius yangii]